MSEHQKADNCRDLRKHCVVLQVFVLRSLGNVVAFYFLPRDKPQIPIAPPIRLTYSLLT
jgi:hypothetical protein